MKKAVIFSMIIFLSTMIFLAPKLTDGNAGANQTTYSANELHKNPNVPDYNHLTWNERLELDKSVWGFGLGQMLVFGVLFGVFFGSIKMAASQAQRPAVRTRNKKRI